MLDIMLFKSSCKTIIFSQKKLKIQKKNTKFNSINLKPKVLGLA